jgi:hypothetical protein
LALLILSMFVYWFIQRQIKDVNEGDWSKSRKKVFKSLFSKPRLTISPRGVVFENWFAKYQCSWREIKSSKVVEVRYPELILRYFVLKTKSKTIRLLHSDYVKGLWIKGELEKYIRLTKVDATPGVFRIMYLVMIAFMGVYFAYFKSWYLVGVIVILAGLILYELHFRMKFLR